MKLDLSRYEGHTPGPLITNGDNWFFNQFGQAVISVDGSFNPDADETVWSPRIRCTEADQSLHRDAPVNLAALVRTRELLKEVLNNDRFSPLMPNLCERIAAELEE